MKIRKATIEDSQILSELGAITFRDAYEKHPLLEHKDVPLEKYISGAFNEDRMLEELKDSSNIFYIMEDEGQPIGYAKLVNGAAEDCIKGEDPISLERIYFLKSFTGKGYGTALLNYCIDVSRELGKKCIWVGVWEGNRGAIDFYIRHGFKGCGSVIFQIANTDYEDTDLVLERAI